MGWTKRGGYDQRGWNKGDPTTFMESGMFMDDNAFFSAAQYAWDNLLSYHRTANARDDKTRQIFLANLNYIQI